MLLRSYGVKTRGICGTKAEWGASPMPCALYPAFTNAFEKACSRESKTKQIFKTLGEGEEAWATTSSDQETIWLVSTIKLGVSHMKRLYSSPLSLFFHSRNFPQFGGNTPGSDLRPLYLSKMFKDYSWQCLRDF